MHTPSDEEFKKQQEEQQEQEEQVKETLGRVKEASENTEDIIREVLKKGPTGKITPTITQGGLTAPTGSAGETFAVIGGTTGEAAVVGGAGEAVVAGGVGEIAAGGIEGGVTTIGGAAVGEVATATGMEGGATIISGVTGGTAATGATIATAGTTTAAAGTAGTFIGGGTGTFTAAAGATGTFVGSAEVASATVTNPYGWIAIAVIVGTIALIVGVYILVLYLTEPMRSFSDITTANYIVIALVGP